MLTKEYINEVKNEKGDAFPKLLHDHRGNVNSLVFILENMGVIPEAFDVSALIDLTTHKNKEVRMMAVKTIGKMKDKKQLELLASIAKEDKDTIVRREAVSSIGRIRNEITIPFLVETLKDDDPKVICQAIRGLLVFKGTAIDAELKELINHQNETVRTIIYKEYFSETTKQVKQAHTESYDYLKNVVINADAIDAM